MKFTIKKDGQDIELEVVSPSVSIRNEHEIQRSKAVIRNAKDEIPLRVKLDIFAKKQGYWSEEKDKEIDELSRELRSNELALKRGGISLRGEARDIALKSRKVRAEILSLSAEKNALDNYSAEGMAEAETLPFLLSKCVLIDGKPYFKSAEDVINRSAEEGIGDINLNFTKVYYNWTPEDISKRFENKFLIDHNLAKVIDYKGEKVVVLLDEEGRLIDDDGRLIDEQLRYVDEDGSLVDRWGNKVDEEGNLVVEEQPFL